MLRTLVQVREESNFFQTLSSSMTWTYVGNRPRGSSRYRGHDHRLHPALVGCESRDFLAQRRAEVSGLQCLPLLGSLARVMCIGTHGRTAVVAPVGGGLALCVTARRPSDNGCWRCKVWGRTGYNKQNCIRTVGIAPHPANNNE